MMKKIRGSMPWNQMIANTTQDSAGMPWNSVRIGERNSFKARERTMTTASAAPTMKAPASPARIRPTVASTSLNWLQLEKMSMQRLKTATREGNKNGGKNSDAICQKPATTRDSKKK